MEYDRSGSLLEDDTLDKKSKKDKGKETASNNDKPVLRPPLIDIRTQETNSRLPETKSLSDSLNELLADKSDDRRERQPAADENHQKETEEVTRVPLEATDLPLHELMADTQEIPLTYSAEALHEPILQYPEPTERAEQLKIDRPLVMEDESNDHEPERQFSAEHIAATEVPQENPLPASEGGGNQGTPPRGPEGFATPEEPEPTPEQPLPAEAAHRTVPEAMRPEMSQRAQAIDPRIEQPEPAPTTRPPAERITERHVERNSGIGLLLVAFEAWRHHRQNKRNRKAQAKIAKRMDQIAQAQAETRQQQLQASRRQAEQQQRVQHELANRPTANELAIEHSRDHLQAEKLRISESLSRPPEKAPPVPEPPEQPPLVLPPEHHMVRSAWHNIEVDKAGHPVEQPVLSYGQEFKREQHQEARRQEELVAAGLVGYSAVNTTMDADQPSSLLTPSTSQAPPTTPSSSATPQAPRVAANLTTVWLLIVLGIIICAIVAALILR